MSFPRYTEYKESGVEWLGDVPEHWDIAQLRRVARVNTGVAKGKDHTGKKTINVPYLRVANVQDGYLDLRNVTTIDILEHELDRYRLMTGDVLMNEGGDFDKLGRGHIWEGQIDPCITQNHVFAVRPTSVPSIWLSRITSSDYAQFYFMTRSNQSTNLASISSTNLMKLPVILPPKDEQKAISSFLDAETAKIDALVAEQQRLIELLKEKRQAVISHAVTKGLNPDAPLKDSGIEWLGEVPEHWERAKKMKAISSLKGRLGWQGLKANEYIDEGPYVVSSAHFENHCIQWHLCPHVSQERYDLDDNIQLSVGDVLLMKDGAAMGKLAFVDHLPSQACLNSHLLLFRPLLSEKQNTYEPRFLFYFMQTDYFQEYVKVNGTGATFLGISQHSIGNYKIILPPHNEQLEISNYLDRETKLFDQLIMEAEQAIELLQERRTALISAAVTGKIDIREYAAQETA